MQPLRPIPRRARLTPILSAAILLGLMASGASLANGPMGGESHHGGGNGPGGPMIVPVPDFTPASGPVGDTVPDGPGNIPYPPSGPDRTDTLINQINGLGQKRPVKSEATAQKCDALRTDINQLENGRGATDTANLDRGALIEQHLFDSWSRMSPAELKAEIAYEKTKLITSEDEGDQLVANSRIRTLSEIKELRARYGNSFVYQNALKDTLIYRMIQEHHEQAALSRRDKDEPHLRDLKAGYAELDC